MDSVQGKASHAIVSSVKQVTLSECLEWEQKQGHGKATQAEAEGPKGKATQGHGMATQAEAKGPKGKATQGNARPRYGNASGSQRSKGHGNAEPKPRHV
ncbi:unnamed protein product [Prunus armeniaca]